MKTNRRRRVIRANEEVVVPETDLLFEAEDVAELVSEITGEDVEVAAEEDAVTFTVGDEEFTVEAEGTEEIVESARSTRRDARSIKASTTVGRSATRRIRRR